MSMPPTSALSVPLHRPPAEARGWLQYTTTLRRGGMSSFAWIVANGKARLEKRVRQESQMNESYGRELHKREQDDLRLRSRRGHSCSRERIILRAVDRTCMFRQQQLARVLYVYLAIIQWLELPSVSARTGVGFMEAGDRPGFVVEAGGASVLEACGVPQQAEEALESRPTTFSVQPVCFIPVVVPVLPFLFQVYVASPPVSIDLEMKALGFATSDEAAPTSSSTLPSRWADHVTELPDQLNILCTQGQVGNTGAAVGYEEDDVAFVPGSVHPEENPAWAHAGDAGFLPVTTYASSCMNCAREKDCQHLVYQANADLLVQQGAAHSTLQESTDGADCQEHLQSGPRESSSEMAESAENGSKCIQNTDDSDHHQKIQTKLDQPSILSGPGVLLPWMDCKVTILVSSQADPEILEKMGNDLASELTAATQNISERRQVLLDLLVAHDGEDHGRENDDLRLDEDAECTIPEPADDHPLRLDEDEECTSVLDEQPAVEGVFGQRQYDVADDEDADCSNSAPDVTLLSDSTPPVREVDQLREPPGPSTPLSAAERTSGGPRATRSRLLGEMKLGQEGEKASSRNPFTKSELRQLIDQWATVRLERALKHVEQRVNNTYLHSASLVEEDGLRSRSNDSYATGGAGASSHQAGPPRPNLLHVSVAPPKSTEPGIRTWEDIPEQDDTAASSNASPAVSFAEGDDKDEEPASTGVSSDNLSGSDSDDVVSAEEDLKIFDILASSLGDENGELCSPDIEQETEATMESKQILGGGACQESSGGCDILRKPCGTKEEAKKAFFSKTFPSPLFRRAGLAAQVEVSKNPFDALRELVEPDSETGIDDTRDANITERNKGFDVHQQRAHDPLDIPFQNEKVAAFGSKFGTLFEVERKRVLGTSQNRPASAKDGGVVTICGAASANDWLRNREKEADQRLTRKSSALAEHMTLLRSKLSGAAVNQEQRGGRSRQKDELGTFEKLWRLSGGCGLVTFAGRTAVSASREGPRFVRRCASACRTRVRIVFDNVRDACLPIIREMEQDFQTSDLLRTLGAPEALKYVVTDIRHRMRRCGVDTWPSNDARQKREVSKSSKDEPHTQRCGKAGLGSRASKKERKQKSSDPKKADRAGSEKSSGLRQGCCENKQLHSICRTTIGAIFIAIGVNRGLNNMSMGIRLWGHHDDIRLGLLSELDEPPDCPVGTMYVDYDSTTNEWICHGAYRAAPEDVEPYHSYQQNKDVLAVKPAVIQESGEEES